ncbi:MAG TPA: RNA pseudouridine synthase [Bacteroidales bacterium]|nr:RNA pseudouridine synthase [Bacteroidales bacterium]
MEILYEDNHIIAINKTNSDIVQVDKTGDLSLEEKIKSYIKEKYNKPGDVFLGVVHRIDRPVSGAVVFARTSKALTRLNDMFKNKDVQKTYWAIVKEKPKKELATLNHYIVRDQQKNKSFAFDNEVKNSKLASLSYKLVAKGENYYLLEIDLHTGRHHQIRCQLAKIGCPIKGDLKYGFPRSNPDGGISLHSRKIEFIHPVKKEKVIIIAKTPKDALWDYFSSIVKD